MGLINQVAGRDMSGREQPVLVTPLAEHGSASLVAAAALPVVTQAMNAEYDASAGAWNHVRGNFDQTLLAATSVSASTAVTATNFGRGIIAYMECTSGIPPGSASVTIALKVQAVSPVGTNRFVTLASTAARSVSGIVACAVGPGLTETSGVAYAQTNRLVPRNIRILASISSGAASFGMVLALGLSTIK